MMFAINILSDDAKWGFNVSFAITRHERTLRTNELSCSLEKSDSRGSRSVWIPCPVATQDRLNGKDGAETKGPNGRITYPVSDHPLFTVDTCQAVSCERLWGCGTACLKNLTDPRWIHLGYSWSVESLSDNRPIEEWQEWFQLWNA